MSNIFDTQKLIDTVKRTANIPDNQSMISDEQIIDYANEEIMNSLLPLIIGKHEDYYAVREDIAISDSSKKRYAVPYRAVGNKLGWFGFYNGDNSDIPTEFNRISFDQISEASGNTFYFENENVVINTVNSTVDADYLVFRYNMQPNTLVDSSRVSIITGIDPTTGTITVSADIPDNFTASSKIDFIRSKQPNNILNYDIDIVDVNTSAKYFQVDPDDIPEALAVGDRICLAGETDVIYAPTAMHSVLAQMVAVRVLESNGDDTRAAQARLNKKTDDAQYLIDNRNSGSPVKASCRRNGLLRSRSRKIRNRN